MPELVTCKDLTKRFGNHTALDHINISLDSGKIIGLLGPNGSGKTTLMKILTAEAHKASSGTNIKTRTFCPCGSRIPTSAHRLQSSMHCNNEWHTAYLVTAAHRRA